MRILCIVSNDDCNTGNVTAVLEIPAGVDKDDLFVKWLKGQSSYYAKKSRDECLEAEYAWNEHEVPQQIPSEDEIDELATKVVDKMQREDAEFPGRFEDVVLVLTVANELGNLKL